MGHLAAIAFVVAVLVAVVSVPGPEPSAAFTCGGRDFQPESGPELIRNGGFEDGLTDWPTTPGPGGANSPAIVSSPVHAGGQAAKVDAVAQPATHANQSLPPLPETYMFTYWFYVESWGPGGQFGTDLFTNWDPGAGRADITSAILPSSSGIQWWVWRPRDGGGATTTVPTSVAPGAWHSFEVVVDSPAGVQCLFLDGASLATLSVDPSLTFAPSIVLFGDVSYAGDAGVAVYDDVSILPLSPTQAEGVCPLSQGFWRNHPAAWPVDSLVLGSESYSKGELLGLLRTPPRGDASLIVGHQLIAAKLNVANGSDPAPIASTVADADALLAAFAERLPYSVSPSSDAGGRMVAAGSLLDDYNNGRLTPGCTSEVNAVTASRPPPVLEPASATALPAAAIGGGFLPADPRRSQF